MTWACFLAATLALLRCTYGRRKVSNVLAPIRSEIDIGSSGTKRVFLFRHCIRDCGGDLDKINVSSLKQEYGPQDISGTPTPDFLGIGGAKGYRRCTTVGRKIMRETGQYLHKEGLVSKTSFRMVMDDVHRDITTGHEIGKGIFGEDEWASVARDAKQVMINGGLFSATSFEKDSDAQERNGTAVVSDPSGKAACAKATNVTRIMEDAQLKLDTVRMPMGVGNVREPGYEARMAGVFKKMTKIIGAGPTLSIKDFLKITTSREGVVGANKVMKYFSQQLFYAWASNMPTNYTMPPKEELLEWAQWIYYSHKTEPQYESVSKGVLIVDAIISDLQSETSPESTLYIGHDTQMDSISSMLNLTWKTGVFGEHGTPPGSAVMFSKEPGSEEVDIKIFYTDFDGKGSGEPKTGKGIPSKMALGEMQSRYDLAVSKYENTAECRAKAKRLVNAGHA